MSKKLLLINPTSEDRGGFKCKGLRMPPLSLGYLAALTPSDWNIKVIDERIEHYKFEEADLVGITGFTMSAPRAYRLASHFKEREITTIMGGIHASMMPEEAAKYVDCVVTGEAEEIWQTVINDFENNTLKPRYNGLFSNMNNLPFPRMDVFSDQYKVKGQVSTARGCPMGCEFCAVTAFHGGRYRTRPVEQVLDELESLNEKTVFFVDDNILGRGKKSEERAIRLFKGIIQRGIKIKWYSQASINFTDNREVLKYAKKSGCQMLFIGFESISEASLKNMNKKIGDIKHAVADYKKRIKKFHKYGIGILGSFILGEDYDDEDVCNNTWKFVLDAGIDCSSFSMLTPFPGTKLYKKLKEENRLIFNNYPDDWYYHHITEHVTFKPKNMTPVELLENTIKAYKKTSSLTISIKRAIKTFVNTKNLYAAVGSFAWNYASYRKLVKAGEKNLKKYRCDPRYQEKYESNLLNKPE